MFRLAMLALFAGFALVGSVGAQTARFAWKAGQVLVYRIDQSQSATEVNEGEKGETLNRLTVTKCWKVLEVDAAGVATVQMWLTAIRHELTKPDGEKVTFDSANPDQSDPKVREQMSKYVNKTLAVLRVDQQGKVVEAKYSHEPPNCWEILPPFILQLPADGIRADQAWQRSYTVVIDPPAGTGEKYAAEQKYLCKKTEAGTAVIGVTTAFRSLPNAAADQLPLLEKQPEGEVVFDTTAGCLRSARLTIDKELKNHQGEGSSYHYKSTYTIEKVESN